MIRPPFLAWLVDTLDFPFPTWDEQHYIWDNASWATLYDWAGE